MDTSYALPFSRRSILRITVILVIGYALTAAAIQLWAQNAPHAADGWVPVSHASRAGSYGFAASDGQSTLTASTGRVKSQPIMISYRPERDPRSAIVRSIAISAPTSETGRTAKPQFVTGLSGHGFYSHP